MDNEHQLFLYTLSCAIMLLFSYLCKDRLQYKTVILQTNSSVSQS